MNKGKRSSNKLLAVLMAIIVLFTNFSDITLLSATENSKNFYVYSNVSSQWTAIINKQKFDDPQAAILAAETYVTGGLSRTAKVLIAVGTYVPKSKGNTNLTLRDKENHFRLANNIEVIGGFVGDEIDIIPTNNQEINSPKTILSGDFGNGDKAYHVFYHKDDFLDETAILNNVVIKDGFASGSGNYSKGGGMYNYSSSPKVINSTFSDNKSVLGGGGMCNSNSSSIVSNCTFVNNATIDSYGIAIGGGMANYSSSNMIIENCTFENNNTEGESTYGGAIYNFSSDLKIIDSSFNNNNSTSSYDDAHGGAIYNDASHVNITDCIFDGNKAFSENDYAYGGAIVNYYSDSKTINSTFKNNTAETKGTNAYGGAMLNTYSKPVVTNCTFENNTSKAVLSEAYGGAISNIDKSEPLILSSKFNGNKAISATLAFGGGVSTFGSTATIMNSIFLDNSATSTGNLAFGGGIYNETNIMTDSFVINCIFKDNKASGEDLVFGGGIYTFSGNFNIIIANSTFYGNRVIGTNSSGGGIYGDNKTELYYSLVSGNTSSGSSEDIESGKLYNSIKGTAVYANNTVSIANFDISNHFDNTTLRLNETSPPSNPAIKVQFVAGYENILDKALARVNTEFNTSFTLATLASLNGENIVYDNNKADIGAYRYTTTPESDIVLPVPDVTAVKANGDHYVSGAIADESVTFFVDSNMTSIDNYPLLPVQGVLNFDLYLEIDGGTPVLQTSNKITVTQGGTYRFFLKYNNIEGTKSSDFVVDFHGSRPKVLTATPTNGAIDVMPKGNIRITFDEDMATAGVVSLSGVGVLPTLSASWEDLRTYKIPYSGLEWGTTYTISISGFENIIFNAMDEDNTYSFTTISQPTGLNITPTNVEVYTSDVAPFHIFLGEVGARAGHAFLTIANPLIVALDKILISTNSTIIVNGLSPGVTTIEVEFYGGDLLVPVKKTVTVTVTDAPEQLIEHTVSYSASTGGSVSSKVLSGQKVLYGTMINLNANPSKNYVFSGWTVNGVSFGNQNSLDYTVIQDSVIVAQFTYDDKDPVDPVDPVDPSPIHPTDNGSNNTSPEKVTDIPGLIIAKDIPKLIIVKDMYGKILASFDVSKEVPLNNKIRLKTKDTNDTFIHFINLEILNEFNNAHKGGSFIFEVNNVEYTLPFNMISNIIGLNEYIAKNKLELKDLELRLTIKKLSGDELEKAQASYKEQFPFGELVSDFYYISIDLFNQDNKKLPFNCNQFLEKISFTIPTKKTGNTTLLLNERINRLSFIQSKNYSKSSIITTNHHSIYVVARNKISFSDVEFGTWFYKNVTTAANKALVVGTGNNLYEPEKAVTRAEFVQMIVNAIQINKTTNSTVEFVDVSQDAWYYDSVMKAKSAHLLGFVKGNEFIPDQPILREEMAYIIAKVANYENIPKTENTIVLAERFSDYDKMNPAYENAIQRVLSLKIMQGVSETNFNFDGETTRAEAATVLVKMLSLFDMIN